jgi:hypothetical protein
MLNRAKLLKGHNVEELESKMNDWFLSEYTNKRWITVASVQQFTIGEVIQGNLSMHPQQQQQVRYSFCLLIIYRDQSKE